MAVPMPKRLSNARLRRPSERLSGFLSERLSGLLAVFLVLAAASSAASRPVSPGDPRGVWMTEDERAALTISECGDRLCGRIVWLESMRGPSGTLRRDEENPDPAKRSEQICGLVVITDLERSGTDTWEGSVYNPQDGKTYSGRITVLSDTALQVRAYVGLPFFGRSQIWTRADSAAARRIDEGCGEPE